MLETDDTLLTLASASPQRRRMLEELGFPLLLKPQEVDETPAGASLEEEVLRLARMKADACLEEGDHSRWIIGVDTAVGIDGCFLGKPATREEAKAGLRRLHDRSHRVASGVVLIDCRNHRRREASVLTEVRFSALSDEEIDWYIECDEWRGAAGGYRIQGRGGLFIQALEGSYHNVVGLPINTIYGMLRAFNYPFRSLKRNIFRPSLVNL